MHMVENILYSFVAEIVDLGICFINHGIYNGFHNKKMLSRWYLQSTSKSRILAIIISSENTGLKTVTIVAGLRILDGAM